MVIKTQRMIKVVEEFGQRWEIKFNPNKTVYLVFGQSKKDKKIEESLSMNHTLIERATSVKYLGIYLNEKMNNTTHLEKKRIATQIAMAKLKKSLINKSTDPEIKVQLYKTFCRPVLYYGLESLSLTVTEKKNLQKVESNILKSLFSLKRRSRTGDFLNAIRIDKTDDRINKIKISYFVRLYENKLTRTLLTETIQEPKRPYKTNCIVNEIKEIIGSHSQNLEQIYEQCKTQKGYKILRNEEETKKAQEIWSLIQKGQNGVDELNQALAVNFYKNKKKLL